MHWIMFFHLFSDLDCYSSSFHAMPSDHTLQSEVKKKGSSSEDKEESDEGPRKRKEVIESEKALKIEVETLQVTFT